MSSVRREITPATIANEIRMARQDPTRRDIVVIFVEGPTDQKFFNKIFSSQNADIKTVPEGPSGIGRTGIQNIVNQLLSQNIDRLIGIRDADFSRLLQTELSPNIFITDRHDLELMLAHCDDAFHAMTCEYAPEQTTLQASSDLRTMLLQVIYPLGLLRFLNETNRLGLNFAKASITDSFDPTTMILSMDEYLRKLLKGSAPSLAETLLSEIQNHPATYDPSELCNGHDFFQILACYFRDKNKKIKKQPGGEGLEHDIRIAYTYPCFKQTGLFQKLFAWAQETNCTLFIDATQPA